jgi:bla regulator protein blaR1
LAHIKRNDYLINILQSIAEIIFFFHPAMWWISNRIRAERENACDDIVLSFNKSPIVLAKALTNLASIQQNKTELAMAFSGNKFSLMNRVKRILNQEDMKLTFKEGVLGALVLVICLFVMSFSTINTIQSEVTSISKGKALETIDTFSQPKVRSKIDNFFSGQESPNDTIKGSRSGNFNYSIGNVNYRIVFKNINEVTAFYINDKPVPKKEWGKYEKEIQTGFVMLKDYEIKIKEHERQMRELDRKMAQKEREMARKEREMVQKEREMAKEKRDVARKERLTNKEEFQKQEELLKKYQEKLAQQKLYLKQQEKFLIQQQEELKKQNELLLIEEKKKNEELEKEKEELKKQVEELEKQLQMEKESKEK